MSRWYWLAWLWVWMAGPALAQEVTVRCLPADAQVWVLRPGYAPELVGAATGSLALPAGAGIELRRSGWQPLRLTVNPGPTCPPSDQPPAHLNPAAGPGERWNRWLYYAGRWGWVGGLVGLGLGLAGWLRWRSISSPPAACAGQLEELLRPIDRGSHPLAGTRVGDLVLLDCLGVGGTAVVYRAVSARDPDPEQAVAVKLMRTCEPESHKRLLREVQICRDLQHPNLIRLIDSGQTRDGQVYLVMELLTGCQLNQVMQREVPMSPRRAAQLLIPVMSAIAAVHSRGIVHRDLKPLNIFVVRDDLVKVTDFGIARGDEYTVATATGIVMGTPAYMAPEQLDGLIEPSLDQYALGVVLFEMLTGQSPYSDPDPIKLIGKHRRLPVPSLRERVPELSEQLDAVVRKMLAKAPEHRYPDLASAAKALQNAVA